MVCARAVTVVLAARTVACAFALTEAELMSVVVAYAVDALAIVTVLAVVELTVRLSEPVTREVVAVVEGWSAQIVVVAAVRDAVLLPMSGTVPGDTAELLSADTSLM